MSGEGSSPKLRVATLGERKLQARKFLVHWCNTSPGFAELAGGGEASSSETVTIIG
jgi:hypothetical protein